MKNISGFYRLKEYELNLEQISWITCLCIIWVYKSIQYESYVTLSVYLRM